MLNILGMIILIIILFIIILLYIGVKIAFIYDKTDSKFKGCLKILILKKIKIYSLEFPSQNKEKEDNEEEESERDIKELFKLAKPCLKYFKDFLKSFVKCISITKLENQLILGLDSYVDTARYIGYIWGAIAIINSSHKNARLSAQPCFSESKIDARGINELDINVLKLIPPVIKLISKKEVRELIKGVRNG
jgi:hypothetical protein